MDLICCAVFNNHLIFFYAFKLFCIVWEGKITGFLSLTKKINIIIYALLLCRRHKHCSIVVVFECEWELELTWCIVFTETVQCTLGILARWLISLLPMVFRCDSDRLEIPVRKALLIIPAGGCMYECLLKRIGRAVCKPLWCIFQQLLCKRETSKYFCPSEYFCCYYFCPDGGSLLRESI